jgi:hypothetical protein
VVKKIGGGALYRNTVSYAGALVVITSVVLILLSLMLSLAVRRPSPYIGIFSYMIFPGFLTLGALIFLYGLFRESRRRHRIGAKEALPYPRIDLNDSRQRKIFTLVLTGGCLLAILFFYVGHNAYTFTDSVTFCGKVCHQVMKPEYTAYLNGPHARVPCVDCHVGPGVPWYVKSKISGVPQVFATLFHTYSRPIPVPIKNLRPARDICEECHWPQKFYGAQLIQSPHFHYDEKNTAEQISLLVRTGGGTPNLGENAGIHWHMAINNKVYFKASDSQQQHIPWIKVVHADGSVAIYKDSRSSLSDKELEKRPVSLMDCMDCHNRPSHVFVPPETAVDRAMEGGTISSQLPWIKKLAVDALVRNYDDKKNVHELIRESIEGYYTKNYPDFKNRKSLVDQAVNAITAIYDQNVFPSMNVNWTTYPNNIGHRNWPGCFRCHDDYHYGESGKRLTSSCSICHTMPQRGPLLPLGATMTFSSKEPWHPWPLKGKHEYILCNRCHRAGYLPPGDCISCHKFSESAPMMATGCGTCHVNEQEVKPLVSCTSCHRTLGELHKVRTHIDAGCTTCHAPHAWKVTARETCLACHEDKKDHNAPAFCGECHHFTAR